MPESAMRQCVSAIIEAYHESGDFADSFERHVARQGYVSDSEKRELLNLAVHRILMGGYLAGRS